MNETNTNALTVASQFVSTYDKVNDPMQAADQLGNWIAKSGMFGCEKVEQGAILAMQCIVERKAPLELAKHYHIIGGKLSLRADAMLALYRERGGKVKWIQYDDLGAKARWVYDGNDVELSYTLEDAKRAGLLPARGGSGWAKFPAEMMRARLISKAVRMLCPEVCTGTYTPEELEDIQRPAQVQAVAVAPQPSKAVEAVVEVLPAFNQVPLQRQVELLIEDENLVNESLVFMRHKKWLDPNQSFENLSDQRCLKVLEKPKVFFNAVVDHANPPIQETAK